LKSAFLLSAMRMAAAAAFADNLVSGFPAEDAAAGFLEEDASFVAMVRR
jgi:hypothetical protein